MLEGFEGVRALWPTFNMPLLALHGEQDAVCPAVRISSMSTSPRLHACRASHVAAVSDVFSSHKP